jgi:hypothetical protein|nr:MAG TPA: hypothetical protein [Caudoviricetes sp.]
MNKKMTTKDILNTEGTVIRKTPFKTVHRWRIYNPNVLEAYRNNGAKIYKSDDGVDIAEETQINKLGDKYIITLENSIDRTVIFAELAKQLKTPITIL